MEKVYWFVLHDPVRRENMRFMDLFDKLSDCKKHIDEHKEEVNFTTWKIERHESDGFNTTVKDHSNSWKALDEKEKKMQDAYIKLTEKIRRKKCF